MKMRFAKRFLATTLTSAFIASSVLANSNVSLASEVNQADVEVSEIVPAAEPTPQENVPAVEPVPQEVASATEPVPQEVAPVVEPTPQEVAPATEPVPQEVAPVVEPVPQEVAPVVEPIPQEVSETENTSQEENSTTDETTQEISTEDEETSEESNTSTSQEEAEEIDTTEEVEEETDDSEVTEDSEESEEKEEEDSEADEEDEEKVEEEEISYPAKSFDTQSIDGITVQASVDEGVFPEGTYMQVSAVDSSVKDQIKSELSVNEIEIVDVLAVDISFIYDGNEIQPKDGKSVNVNLYTEREVEGQNHKAIHVEDSGNVKVVAEANCNCAEIAANSFSVYGIIGEDYDAEVRNYARYTYNFHYQNSVINTQIVRDGDKLYIPFIPTWETDERFIGWEVAETGEIIDFNSEVHIPTSAMDTTFEVYAKFEEYYKVFFYLNEERSTVIQTITAYDGETVDIHSVTLNVGTDKKFVGWKTFEGTNVGTSVTINGEDIELFPIVESGGYWVYFDSNGGSYINPVFIEEGNNVPTPNNPTKAGYDFISWQLEGIDYDFEQVVSESLTLVATWQAKTVEYKIAYWLEDVQSDNYNYDSMKTKHGIAGQDPVFNPSTDGKTYKDTNGVVIYFLDEEKTNASIASSGKIKGDGSTVINVYYYRYYFTLRVENLNGKTKEYKVKAEERYYNKIVQDFPDISNYSFSYYFSYTNNEFRADNVIKSISTLTTRIWGIEHRNKELIIVKDFLPYVPRAYTYNLYLMNEKLDSNDITNPENYEVDEIDTWTNTGSADAASKRGPKYGFEFYGIQSSNKVIQSSSTVFSMYPEPYQNKMFYRRVRNNINFNTGEGTPISTITQVPYEKPLSNYSNIVNSYVIDSTEYTDNNGVTYTFKGWFDNPAYTGNPIDFTTDKMPAHGLYLHAKWERPSFTITFDANGGSYSGVLSTNVEIGENVSKPTDPQKDDYVFIGWQDEEGKFFDFKTRIYKNYDLTAVYMLTEDAVYYSVVYDAGSYGIFTEVDEKRYFAGSKAVVLGNPTDIDPEKIFVGWQINGIGTVYISGAFTISPSDADSTGKISLVAKYIDKYPELISVTYNPNTENGGPDTGNVVYNNETQNNGTITLKTLDEVSFETVEGYEFKCWNTQADGLGDSFQPGEIIAVSITGGDPVIYAIWEGLEDSLVYNSNAINSVGMMLATEGRTHSTVTVSECDFERLGYTFTGWNTLADGTGIEYAVGSKYTLTTGDDILYAQWSKVANEYLIEIDFADMNFVYTVTSIVWNPEEHYYNVTGSFTNDTAYFTVKNLSNCQVDMRVNYDANLSTNTSGWEVGVTRTPETGEGVTGSATSPSVNKINPGESTANTGNSLDFVTLDFYMLRKDGTTVFHDGDIKQTYNFTISEKADSKLSIAGNDGTEDADDISIINLGLVFTATP